MNRKHTYEDLKVVDIVMSEGVIEIRWQCKGIGFGSYIIGEGREGIELMSECMDRGDDKAFLRALLGALADYLDEFGILTE